MLFGTNEEVGDSNSPGSTTDFNISEKIIRVRVSAGAKTEKVEEVKQGLFKVRVGASAEKGRANARVLELLAGYFHVSKSKVFLVSGATYKEKVVMIDL